MTAAWNEAAMSAARSPPPEAPAGAGRPGDPRRAARAIATPDARPEDTLRPGVDASLTVLSIGGLAALVASAHEAARPFFDEPIAPEVWRRHLYDMLLHGILSCPPANT